MTNWSDPASRGVNTAGVKAQVGSHPKSDYSVWRRQVGHGCFVNDVDWVEWRVDDEGKMRLVALIETTAYEDIPAWREKLPQYRAAALDRFKRDAQYGFTTTVARLLGVPAYFVIVRYDVAMFQVYSFRRDEWREMNEAGYRQWLVGL